MSAVAAPTVANGNHDSTRDPSIEQSPSRFTAVNGRDPPSLLHSSSDLQPLVDRSHECERSVESRPGSDHQKISPAQKELLMDSLSEKVNHDQIENLKTSDACSASLNRNKRKRSDSSDRHPSPSTTNHTQSNPRSPNSKADDSVTVQARSLDTNGIGKPATTPESETAVKTMQRQYSSADPTDETNIISHRPSWDSRDSRSTTHGEQSAPPAESSDAQVAEALQRDVQDNNVASKAWDPVPNGHPAETTGPNQAQLATHATNQPDDQDKPHHQIQPPNKTQTQPQSKSQAQSQTPATQPGPKRKRVFSNRTKTGCMTCRRRKKKCDEQHPACNNCIRGNFPCEGYSVRSTWQKPANPKGPVPLQSKGNYPEVAHPYTHEMSPQRHDARIQATMLPDGSKSRPVPVDEADRAATQYISSPPGPGSRNSWLKSSWTAQGPTAYLPDGPPKPEFRESSGLKEMSRADKSKSEYPVVHSSCELTHSTHAKPGMAVFQTTMEQRSGPPRIDPANYSAQARMALNMEPHITFESSGKTEKEKMLSGEQYRPFDPQLIKDRERCKAALWRFANAGNPIYGISAIERTRLLNEVLIPSSEGQTESVSSNLVGSLGPGAVVEAPFNCHYGYNINIGEDVLISENCFFADDCTITVGAHTWIGPNVTILSSMAIGSMQERKGSQSRYQGRPVVIAEDCWIGAGCTILPGVTLGRGAYIAPGEVVRSQILPYGFQGLKPNYP
ncbi:maltose O-acetyltransferase [Coccidioides immitis RMSCC 2394]|uniref:Maltose O-acetyltransferase n=1 Tax=Coccidioides immitis RMSCC 2394 TaxID=404692 RepID=A0A0J6YC74_COCIT|nr:maltose O-acetyltransferase [Coccidioides immitis RMSCC 2394]